MDEHQKLAWNKRLRVPRWFPAWLGVCLAVGAAVCVTCWFAMDRLSGIELAVCFGIGFALTLGVLTTLGMNTDQATNFVPPRWVRLPIVGGVLCIVGYAWLQAPPPANVDPPGYVVWLLWGCVGWFGIRLLWIAGDMVRALWTGAEMHPQSSIGSTFSIAAGAVGGFLLVVFLWPAVQKWSWHGYLACAAVLLGVPVGFALDGIFMVGNVLLLRRLLAFRLPHFQKQLCSTDSVERARAAAAIYHMGTYAAAAVPDLIEAVKDESPEVRTQATLALWGSRVNDPGLLAALQALLHDSETRMRIAAAGALVDRGAGKAPEVLSIFSEGLMHPEEQFAYIAASSLGRLGQEAAPAGPALRTALFDRQPPCESALAALDSIGEAGTPILAEALKHPNRSVRQAAADLLVRKGKKAAAVVPALQAALADEDDTVRRAAAKALKKIEGS